MEHVWLASYLSKQWTIHKLTCRSASVGNSKNTTSYTASDNLGVGYGHCHYRSELSCKTQPFETVAAKYSSSDVSTILIFTMVTLKNLRNQLSATAATKKKDVATKRLRTRSAFRQSLIASVGESQVVVKKQVWYLSFTSQGY